MQKELQRIEKQLPSSIVIEECLTESYFSNSLAWLLNPKISGNKVEFINEFAKLVAKKRAKDEFLHKKSTTIKFSKRGNGTSYSNFAFANSHTSREYHLSRSIKGELKTNYCDIMIFDLDHPNSIVITIENKLFGQINKAQLKKYHSQCEKKFKSVSTREYVVLGIDKAKPKTISKEKNWIYLSWIYDIKPIVDKLEIKSRRYKNFESVLGYLMSAYSYSKSKKYFQFSQNYISSFTNCLLNELQRIKTDRGHWEIVSTSSVQNVIIHTSSRRKKLYIEYLTNYNIAIQSHSSSKKPLYEKVCIPFGLNEDQLLNQIELFAKDIYKYHFGDSHKLYLGRKHRRNRITNPFPKKDTKIFTESYKYNDTLKQLLKLSKNSITIEEQK